jgi:hypothetical protein
MRVSTKVKMNPARGIVRDFIESYEAEARLLEEVIEYTERSEQLAVRGDYSALCDCLLGRGERIEAIARLEEERRKLEKEFTGRIHEDVKGARERALIAHGKAILANNRLRAVLSELKAGLEEKLAAVENGKTVARAYDGVSAPSSISMFLDRDR